MADSNNPVYTDFVSSGVANSDVASDAPTLNWVRYGVPSAAASAAASLWNGVDYLAVKLGTAFGDEMESARTDTSEVLGKVGLADGKLQDYYYQHQAGADTGGFLLGAFIPGLGAIKGLQGLQAGARGLVATEGTAGATGLLTNTAHRYYIGKAATSIKAGGEGFTRARWGAAAAKGGQWALEGAAFEIGAYAAMHQSSQYSDVDNLWDLGKVVATGAAFGGALGGLVGAGGIAAAKISDTGLGATIGKLRDSVGEQLTRAGLLRQKAGGLEDVLTPGDVLADLYRTERGALSKTGDVVLDGTLDAARKNQNQAVETLFNKLFVRLAGDEAPALRQAVEALPAQGKLELLVGATKISKVAPTNLEESLSSSKTFFFDTGTGTTSQKAVLLAGDLGTLKWAGEALTLDGKALNLTKEMRDFEGLLTSEAWRSNAAYLAANEQVAAQKLAGLKMPGAVSHESIPLIEAQLRNFDAIAITGVSRQSVNTRNLNKRFHGTSSELKEVLDSAGNSEFNIFGQGFYTTNAVDVARGYMKKGKGTSPTLYEVSVAPNTKLFSMEAPLQGAELAAVRKALGRDADQIPGTTLREIYNELRAESSNLGYSVHTVQEIFDSIRYNLEKLGYQGFSHIGGVAKVSHNVDILWTPETSATLRKVAPTEFTSEVSTTIRYEGAEALEALRQIKTEAMIAARESGMPLPEIAARLNITDTFLTTKDATREMFVGATDPTKRRYFAVEYDTANAPTIWQAQGAAVLDARIAGARQQNQLVASNILGRELPELELADLKALEHRFAGMFTAANANYLSVLEKAQAIGRLRQKAAEEMATSRAAAMVGEEQALRNFGEKSAESVAFAALAARVRATGMKYLAEEGKLISLEWKAATTPEMRAALVESDHVIPLRAGAVSEAGADAISAWIAAHITQDAIYLDKQNAARQAMGKPKLAGAGTFYIPPPPVDSRKFTAIVVSPDGGKAMLFAKNADELTLAINRTREAKPDARIVQKADTDAWFKAVGEYEAEAAYGATKLDNALARKGAMSPEQPGNSFQVLDEVNAWYARKEYAITASAVELRYGQQLAEARIAALALSPGGSSNAFTKVADLMLGRSTPAGRLGEFWANINASISNGIDAGLEATWGRVRAAKQGAITWEEASKVADAYGVNAFESQALWDAAGAKNWNGAAMKAVKEVNTVQRIAVLGLDYWNGVVNAIGTPILLLPEMKAAMAAGKQPAYMELVGNAISNYFKKPEMLARYDKAGIVDKGLTAHRELVDAHGLIVGAKTSGDALRQAGIAQSAAGRFLDTMQTPTNWSERFTRFIGADVGRQIAELRGLAGVEADAFAANFANKVSGNFTAGQRPQVFQGILGNAVGLFQSYQFNYMQQLFKHMAEGEGKNVAMMMALQGTIFGAQSLPGFAVANHYLLEKHNQEHSGIYSSVRQLVGEDVGNAVLYGTASNLLGANLWTRGDTSPRNVTLLPVTPSDIAAVQYMTKAVGAGAEFASSMLNGGSLKVSGLEAVAHAGINRPLAGMAEWALGARTSQGGKLDMPVSQDLLSIATAVRFLGAKPMDEAIKMETFYRFNKMKAADAEKTKTIAAAFRTQLLDQATGGDAAALDEFAKRYSDAGGSPENFRKFYLQNLKAVTTPRAVALANTARKSPWANNYQMLLEPGEIPALGAEAP